MENTLNQQASLDEWKISVVSKMRKHEKSLNSPEMNMAIANEPNQERKKALLKARRDCEVARARLENAILADIEARLKSLKSDLDIALKELDIALQKINNTVAILNTINVVTRILGRIVNIV